MSDTNETFEFDLTPKEITYKLNGINYLLTEVSEDVWAKHQDLMARGTKFDAEGKPSHAGDHFGSANTVLVAGCLFKMIKTGAGEKRQPVTVAEIRNWPARVTQALAKKINEISELAKKETVESLRADIAKLQKRLADLEAKGEPSNGFATVGQELAKNEPNASTVTSAAHVI